MGRPVFVFPWRPGAGAAAGPSQLDQPLLWGPDRGNPACSTGSVLSSSFFLDSELKF